MPDEYIQVEVNEENILRFNLPQLTGNSTEEMLVAAREAEIAGHVLTCKIPKPEGYEPEHNINMFDAASSVPSEPEEPPDMEAVIMYDNDGHVIDVDFTQRPVGPVIEGEVVDDGDPDN